MAKRVARNSNPVKSYEVFCGEFYYSPLLSWIANELAVRDWIYKGGGMLVKQPRYDVIMIGDFLKDPDDEHALLLAVWLHLQGLINLRCVIANLNPAELRARGAKGTLQQVGFDIVPVGIGMEVRDNFAYPYEADVPYLASPKTLLWDGQELLEDTLQNCRDGNVILVLQSAFTDAAMLFGFHGDLCKKKICQVAIMGGLRTESGWLHKELDGYYWPNDANNNCFDKSSAQWLYRELQEKCIRMVITSSAAAYACQMPIVMLDQLEATGNPVGACLKARQLPALQQLWEDACLPIGSAQRGTLPDNRTREWFINVYCGGVDPKIQNGADITRYIRSFNLYDPINLLAGIPFFRDEFFNPATFIVHGIGHHYIGVSDKCTGILHVEKLREFIIKNEIAALTWRK